MAQLSIRMYSNYLQRTISFRMYLPNDPRLPFPGAEPPAQKPFKTIFLLHGYTGDADNWIPEWLCDKYHIAVVMPNGENGFWLDGLSTGHMYESFVAVELVEYVRKTFGLARDKEETFVMGLSMGGYGALHFALAHPETFGRAYALSSALIIHGIAHMKENEQNPVANYAYYHECFGDLETVEERDCNPEVLVRKLKAEGREFPKIYMACGTEDFLIEPNRNLHAFLENEGVEHVYMESKGIHDMVFWSEYARKFIEMTFEE